jgi:hypothetical protein
MASVAEGDSLFKQSDNCVIILRL